MRQAAYNWLLLLSDQCRPILHAPHGVPKIPTFAGGKPRMNAFDASIQTYLSHVAPSSGLFAHAVAVIAGFALFKGLAPLAIMWAIWFKRDESLEHRREMVVAIMSAALVAFVLGRLLALVLPFRLRPIDDASLHL